MRGRFRCISSRRHRVLPSTPPRPARRSSTRHGHPSGGICNIISVASNYIILELPTVVYNLLSTIKGAHSALKLHLPCSRVHPCAHTDARSHRVLVQASSRHLCRLFRHLHRLRRPLRRRSANRPSSPPPHGLRQRGPIDEYFEEATVGLRSFRTRISTVFGRPNPLA